MDQPSANAMPDTKSNNMWIAALAIVGTIVMAVGGVMATQNRYTLGIWITYVGAVVLLASFFKAWDDAGPKSVVSEHPQANTPASVQPTASALATTTVASASPPSTTTAPVSAHSLSSSPTAGLESLQAYYDRLSSFGKRLGMRDDFLKSTEGASINWEVQVVTRDVNNLPEMAVLLVAPPKAAGFYSPITVSFRRPTTDIADRIRALDEEDIVQISGKIVTGIMRVVEGETIVLVRTGEQESSLNSKPKRHHAR